MMATNWHSSSHPIRFDSLNIAVSSQRASSSTCRYPISQNRIPYTLPRSCRAAFRPFCSQLHRFHKGGQSGTSPPAHRVAAKCFHTSHSTTAQVRLDKRVSTCGNRHITTINTPLIHLVIAPWLYSLNTFGNSKQQGQTCCVFTCTLCENVLPLVLIKSDVILF